MAYGSKGWIWEGLGRAVRQYATVQCRRCAVIHYVHVQIQPRLQARQHMQLPPPSLTHLPQPFSQGWLTEKYWSEDYVLGLALMQGPWQARLLQEYLVIHKGP